MDRRLIALILGSLTVVFVVMNFTLDAGTIFLILAAVAGLGANYMVARPRRR